MLIKEYKNQDALYSINDRNEYLTDLKKINIFVGANNSGKSKFLRQMFKGSYDDFVFFENNELNKKLEKIYLQLNKTLSDLFFMKDLKSLIGSRSNNYNERFNAFYYKIENIKGRSTGNGNVWDLDVAIAIKREMERLDIYKELPNSVIRNKHVYIPMLRGLRHVDVKERSDFYEIRTNLDYKLVNGENSFNHEIFSGLTIYEEIKKMLLGKKEDRDFIKNFESFLSYNFFEKQDITLISDYQTDALKINIDSCNEDREIFNVGDGIQSIIINTFPAFKYQNENLTLFIEEPEITMHPSVQRVLIEVLTSKFKNLQVFLTTHSNHFLDLAYDFPDDIAIFSFEEKNKKFNIKNIGTNVKILNLLGIRNSSVFLSNCVIWTEGVTDRMLLRKLIKMADNFNHKEDYNYSFAEYGGSNLENFDFVNSEEDGAHGVNITGITKTNYVIADNDGINGTKKDDLKNKKYIRRKRIESVLGKNSFFDDHIEIENLIPYKVWIEVIKNLIKDKDGKMITLKEKGKNDEENFDAELKNKKIGFLLKKYLIKVSGEKAPIYFEKDDIQCLGEDKKEIMDYVIKIIDELGIELETFPETTQRLIKSLIEFINKSNNINI